MATKMSHPDRQFVTPAKLDMQYLYFDSADIRWLAACFVCAAICYQLYGFLVAVAVAVVAGLSLIRTREGRIYYWLIDQAGCLYIRYIKKGKVFEVSEKTPFYNPFGTVYNVSGADSGSIGLVQVDRAHTYAAAIIIDGVNTASDEAAILRRRRGQLAAKFSQHTTDTGLSWLTIRRPWNPWPRREFMGAALNPYVHTPERDDEIDAGDDEAKRSQAAHRFLNTHLGQLEDVLRQTAQEVQQASVVVVPGNDTLPKKPQGTIAYRAFQDSPIKRGVDAQLSFLRAYGAQCHIASYEEMKQILYSSVSSKGMPAYYDAVDKWRRLGAAEPLHLPARSVRAYKDHLVIDGEWMGVVQATTLPGVADPRSFTKLFGLLDRDGHPLNMSLVKVGTNVSAEAESKWVNRFLVLEEGFRALYLNSRRSYQSQQRTKEAEDRQTMLGSSRNQVHSFNILGFVFADNQYQFEDNMSVVMAAFSAEGMTPVAITGERRLIRAMKSSWGVNAM